MPRVAVVRFYSAATRMHCCRQMLRCFDCRSVVSRAEYAAAAAAVVADY